MAQNSRDPRCRVTCRMGPRHPPAPARAFADDRAPRQWIGIRPRGRTRRRLGSYRTPGGSRQGPETLLCSHDTGPTDPVACAVRGASPFTGLVARPILCRATRAGQTAARRAALEYRIVRSGLDNLDLGFAGRRSTSDPVPSCHRGSVSRRPLQTRLVNGEHLDLLNRDGLVVGRLAGTFSPPAGTRRRSATVPTVVG